MGNPAWTYWLCGGAVALAGLALLSRALFADRSRGRRRCPRCWYDMTGMPGMVCPECGRDARRETRLRKTRRRWRVAATASLISVAGMAVATLPAAPRDGWLSLAPTTVLLVAAPRAGDGYGVDQGRWRTSQIVLELKRRGAQDSLAGWQWAWYIRNKGVIEFPDRWPAATPLQVIMHEPAWLQFAQVQLRTSPHTGPDFASVGLTEHGASLSGMSIGGNRHIPISIEDTGRVSFDVRVITQAGGFLSFASPERVLWNGCISPHIRMVPGAREMFEVLEGADWDARARERITPSIHISIGPVERRSTIYCTWAMDRSAGSDFEDVAVGFELQLLKDGEVRSVEEVHASRCDGYQAIGARPKGSVSFHPSKLAPEIAQGLSSWTLRVVGRPELAVGDFRRSKAWSGEFELRMDSITKIDR